MSVKGFMSALAKNTRPDTSGTIASQTIIFGLAVCLGAGLIVAPVGTAVGQIGGQTTGQAGGQTTGQAAANAGQNASDAGQAGTVLTYLYRAAKAQTTRMPGQEPTEIQSRLRMTWTVEPLAGSSCRIRVSDAALHREPAGSPSRVNDINGLQAVVHLGSRGDIETAEGLGDNAYVRELGGTAWFIAELERLFLYRPEGELVPGAEWTREREFQAARSTFGLKYVISDTFRCTGRTTVEGIEALRIEVSSAINFTGEGEVSGYSAEMSMTGSGTSTILVEAATGFILSNTEDQDTSGGIYVEGVEIGLAGVGTITVEIVRE